MLRFAALGSGSSGNSALVYSEQTRLLIDAGISAKQLRLRLALLGVEPEQLDGILVTHEHGDHTRGLEVFCRKVEAPIYCSPITRESMQRTLTSAGKWRMIESGQPFLVGDIGINAFAVMHDAVDPLGFVFEHGGARFGFASDLGHVTGVMRRALKGVHSLFLEANYDDVMLQNDTKRPWSLKQRVSSRHGHLSNAQAAELVAEIAADGQLQRVLLGHLSEDCNCPEAAETAIKVALQRERLPEVELGCAGREAPTGPFAVDANAVQTPAAVPVEPIGGEPVGGEPAQLTLFS
jgi:phosphoribosyl 1,2-cyclic phosphodiesterase